MFIFHLNTDELLRMSSFGWLIHSNSGGLPKLDGGTELGSDDPSIDARFETKQLSRWIHPFVKQRKSFNPVKVTSNLKFQAISRSVVLSLGCWTSSANTESKLCQAPKCLPSSSVGVLMSRIRCKPIRCNSWAVVSIHICTLYSILGSGSWSY